MDDFRKIGCGLWTVIRMGGVLVLTAQAVCAQSNLEVDGLGWFGDRRMDQRIGYLLGRDEKEEARLDSAILEDAAYLLLEQMRRRGYLMPSVRAEFSGASEQTGAYWKNPYAVRLPVGFTADSVVYTVQPGPMFFYDSVAIHGLGEIDLREPERFFVPGGSLITRRKDLAYTSENFERRKNRLLSVLEALGFADAQVVSDKVTIDEATGAVRVELEVDAGPLHKVGPVSVEVVNEGAEWPQLVEFSEGLVFNPEWLREARASLRNAAYSAGHPDVKVYHRFGEVIPTGDEVLQPVVFELHPGPQVRLAGLRFEGDAKTKRSVLKRQADLRNGALLDPRQTDLARRRLMALGIYRQVALDYEPRPGGAREAVYRLTPEGRRELELLVGWGSYEQVRAGFLWTHRNPFGRAHRYSVGAKQSLKARRVETGYQMPQLFGTNLTGYSDTEYSSRQEIGYDRSRQGGLLGVASLLSRTGVRLALEYGWFIERAEGIDDSGLAVDDDATVASLSLSASLDRRDSVLAPTSGYNLFATIKTANRVLGGSVDFQKFELGGGHHFSVSESTLLHLGLRGGILLGRKGNLPFNERFFPGGENSVRGFQQGEASPLDPGGDPIGAVTFWLANFELEQRLLSELSFVGFYDIVGFGQNGASREDDELLHSVGLGLRYQTVVGPVRLEYGHNLNPRERDPSGTIHFSVGFPF